MVTAFKDSVQELSKVLEAPVSVAQAMRETHAADGAANVALNLASLVEGPSTDR